MLLYRLIRGLLRFVLGVFYRQIEVVGLEHVPAEGQGPVLFAGNHPNSLLDPLLIICFSGRILHFAAKDVLFKSRLLRPVLLGLGAVPVARRSDHGEGPLDNQRTFDMLFQVLTNGRAVGIFPEGISHDLAQLQRLKTGAARIAFGAAGKAEGLRIVPCGLNYVRRKRFRTRVLVQFGPPIEIDAEWLRRHAEDERQAVRDLTEVLEEGIRGLTVNAADWDVLRVLDGVRRLYQPPGITLLERIELARRFNAVYPTVKDEPEVVALYDRVKGYLDRLRALDLTDRDLRRNIHAGEVLLRLCRHVLLMLVFLPLALPGVALHLPLGLFIGWAGLYFAPRKDVIATTKFVLGLLVMLLLFLATLVLIGLRFGWLPALVASVLIPLSGYATLRVLERGAALRQIFRTLSRLLFLREEIVALREERAALELAVVEAVNRFRPKDMVLLFPRGGAGEEK